MNMEEITFEEATNLLEAYGATVIDLDTWLATDNWDEKEEF